MKMQIEEEFKNLAIHSEASEKDGVHYFTLFNKQLQKPNSEFMETKLKKVMKRSPSKKDMPTKRIKTMRRENIQLETVLGKLLTSYALLRPKATDPTI